MTVLEDENALSAGGQAGSELAPKALLVPPLGAPEPRPPAQNPVDVYLARLGSAHSRRTMESALERIAAMLTGGKRDARSCPWWVVRYAETAALRARLAERYSAASANKHLAALRGVMRETWRLGLIDADAFRRAIDVATVKGAVLPAGREVSGGELAAVVAVCRHDPSAAGPRDGTILALLVTGGLRRSEAVGIDVADCDSSKGAISVRLAKGNKARKVYLAQGGAEALREWLSARGSEAGPLLCPVGKSGRVTIRRLSTQAILDVCRKRAREACAAEFSPHDLRRTFVGDLLDAGVDLATVQRLAGHESPTTTSRYDRRGERAKERAVRLLHFPWVTKEPSR